MAFQLDDQVILLGKVVRVYGDGQVMVQLRDGRGIMTDQRILQAVVDLAPVTKLAPIPVDAQPEAQGEPVAVETVVTPSPKPRVSRKKK